MNARLVGLFAMAAALSGCVTDGPARPGRQPSDIRPAKLIPAANGSFADTDANRYRDSSTVVVYIMGDVPGYHLPIAVPGEFTIRLEDPRGKPVAEWSFDKTQTAAALGKLPPGPGYVFELDLRKSPMRRGSDVIEEPEADLVVEFTPEKGEPIKARTTAPIVIGPSNRAGR